MIQMHFVPTSTYFSSIRSQFSKQKDHMDDEEKKVQGKGRIRRRGRIGCPEFSGEGEEKENM